MRHSSDGGVEPIRTKCRLAASISTEDMAFHQKRCAESDIRELISQCRDRYCFAHELFKPHAILPDRLFGNILA